MSLCLFISLVLAIICLLIHLFIIWVDYLYIAIKSNTMLSVLYSLLEVLIVLVPILLSVAFMTIIERKVLASMQRRVGPNKVGYYGVLQPFSDALKLVVKETVVPQHSTKSLFFLAPIISLIFSLLG